VKDSSPAKSLASLVGRGDAVQEAAGNAMRAQSPMTAKLLQRELDKVRRDLKVWRFGIDSVMVIDLFSLRVCLFVFKIFATRRYGDSMLILWIGYCFVFVVSVYVCFNIFAFGFIYW
jgi:hypothetical protein